DALQAIRAGRGGQPEVPVVALTADAMAGDRERFLRLGFDEHLAKPLSPQALAAVLAACQGSGQPLSAAAVA
ncbi:MAG: hybrid sensor histidine kinase/response regulator, partial [Phenylobacterium sp.]|nr:hybrid sensor histidine kinase/response regulator [Phenylobacterium sp.]